MRLRTVIRTTSPRRVVTNESIKNFLASLPAMRGRSKTATAAKRKQAIREFVKQAFGR